MDRKIRVLLAKPGLDGHDRGAKIVARALMEKGMEVIYTGIRKTPRQIANIALQEDVDVLGLSSLSGGHRMLFVEVAKILRELGKKQVLLIGGGVIPKDDIDYLKDNGIAKVFTPGTDTGEIAKYIRDHAKLS